MLMYIKLLENTLATVKYQLFINVLSHFDASFKMHYRKEQTDDDENVDEDEEMEDINEEDSGNAEKQKEKRGRNPKQQKYHR